MFVSYIVVYRNLVVLCAVRSKRESGSIGVICHSKQMLVGILNFDICCFRAVAFTTKRN